jgi:DNA-binding protein H-NS
MPNYQELIAQRDELNRQIDEARRTEVAEATRRVKDIIREHGLTAAQCGFGAGAAGTKKTRTPRQSQIHHARQNSNLERSREASECVQGAG